MHYPPSGPTLWGILAIIGGWLLAAVVIDQIGRWRNARKKSR